MRPEGADGGGYDAAEPDPHAWEDFTPWRPGDASEGGGQHRTSGQDATPDGWSRWSSARADDDGRQARDRPAGGQSGQRDRDRGAWWTERQPAVYSEGDRVRVTEPVGGLLGGAVPTGTTGHVEATRTSLVGDAYATVKFDNGYTTEVQVDSIERKGWF